MSTDTQDYYVHESSFVDDGAVIGKGTKIWHFSHVLSGAIVGENCSFGQNVSIASQVVIGNNVKVQNNVSIYEGLTIEDDVFLGPSCVLTNVSNPRSQILRKSLYEPTVLKRGCSIGANATIVCGVTIGRYALIASGAVITNDVPDYALMIGVPAKQAGWVSRHGHRLKGSGDEGSDLRCPESGLNYAIRESTTGVPELYCLDIPEDEALPASLSVGTGKYRQFSD